MKHDRREAHWLPWSTAAPFWGTDLLADKPHANRGSVQVVSRYWQVPRGNLLGGMLVRLLLGPHVTPEGSRVVYAGQTITSQIPRIR